MEVPNRHLTEPSNVRRARPRGRLRKFVIRGLYYGVMAVCVFSIFHSSLLVTSKPLTAEEIADVNDALEVLRTHGFEREAFILSDLTIYRSSDNWLNRIIVKDNAYAATNFPLNVVTLYPDFFHKTTDPVEKAMVLLHEARHLQGADENDAYGYAWQNREKLGWTILTHGTTDTYISTEAATREAAPEIFTCADHLWNDCTEIRKPAQLARKSN